MKNRNLVVDTLRGLACLLLVSYHVIGADVTSGLKLSTGILRDLNDIFAYVRMPLFTFLSGIVYAYRPFSSDVKRFITGKFRRLIVPMLVVGTMFALLQAFTPGTSNQIQNWQLLHIIPVAHFWFIEALFVIFLIMIPLESFGLFATFKKFAIVFVVISVLHLLKIGIVYFSLSGVSYLFPYFLLGMGVQRYNLARYFNTKLTVALSATAIALLTFILVTKIGYGSRCTLPALLVGGCSCVALLSLSWQSSFLARIGIYSYSIYLFHVFFSAFARILVMKFGVTNVYILFLLSLSAGITGPMLVELVMNGTNLTRLIFLGKSNAKRENLWFTRRLPFNATLA